jgi:hypothetical protein
MYVSRSGLSITVDGLNYDCRVEPNPSGGAIWLSALEPVPFYEEETVGWELELLDSGQLNAYYLCDAMRGCGRPIPIEEVPELVRITLFQCLRAACNSLNAAFDRYYASDDREQPFVLDRT